MSSLNSVGGVIAGAALVAYVYLRLSPQPADANGNQKRPTEYAKSPAVLQDKRWSALRFYNKVRLNPQEWGRIQDPSAVVKFTRDRWTRDDDGYDPELVTYNPARRNQRMLTTGGSQPIPNPRGTQLHAGEQYRTPAQLGAARIATV
jgi:hypothetical protein